MSELPKALAFVSATAVIALVALRLKPPHCSDIATAKAMAIFRNENSTDLAKAGSARIGRASCYRSRLRYLAAASNPTVLCRRQAFG